MNINAVIPAPAAGVGFDPPARVALPALLGLGSGDGALDGRSHDAMAAAQQLDKAGRQFDGSLALFGPQTKLQLDIDEAAGEVYGRIVDKTTGKAIAEVPSREVRALMARARELLGPLCDVKA